jgi:hypothetical protein
MREIDAEGGGGQCVIGACRSGGQCEIEAGGGQCEIRAGLEAV